MSLAPRHPGPYSDMGSRTEDLLAMEKKLAELRRENERLTRWVEDLQGDCWVNCVYCGFRFGHVRDLPFTTREVFTRHMRACESFWSEVRDVTTEKR